ncbi:MAG TPA: arginine--tRNA ligase [Verrucomicrobiae bacterium]|nr:arginine--tRNA ligase [Verrucomicrobiae bacterium]
MKDHLQALLRSALETVLAGTDVSPPASIVIDATKDTKHGDFATNVALALAKPLGKPPRAVAESIIKALPASDRVAKTEIAGPGFINFFLAAGSFQAVVPEILEQKERFGRGARGKGRVLVEFVSANPTGPLHVGHGRGAAFGDTIANVLDAAGWDVWREYYINDAGRQVDVLAVSVWLRYLETCGESVRVPARGYPGDYVRATAAKLKDQHGDSLKQSANAIYAGLPVEPPLPEGADDATADRIKAEQEKYLDALIERVRSLLGARYAAVQEFALTDQLAAIRATLENFGVRFDQWYSEAELVRSGAAERARAQLVASGHTYEKDGALWFRTTEHGDDKDRVMVRANGTPTYFGNDLAYHVDKLTRGWSSLIDVWGADHHGLLVRMRAAIQSLTGRTDALRIPLIQFVTLSSGRMGKRSGNFVTLNDLITEAGRDETRFFYLLRSSDQHLEFDIELARSKTNDNPVYYVQYACARIASVFRQADERGITWDTSTARSAVARLVEPHEKALLTLLNRYPAVLQDVAGALTPHTLVYFVREIADAFHSYYNSHPFLVDDAQLRDARLSLVAAAGQVLRNGLGLLGVSAPEKM